MKLFSTFLLAAATAVTAQAAETVFECPLNTQEQADQWTVIDNNHDDYTWEFDDYLETMGCSTTNPDMGADDWLISPEINVEAGMYMLAFEYRGSSGDKMDVFYGNGQTIEDMDNLLLDLPSTDGDFITYTKMFTVAEDGKIYLGFHAKSDAWSYQVTLRNVKLTTSEGKDLQAMSVSSIKSGYNLGSAPVKLSIYNNGVADVSNFQVAYQINENPAVTETVNATIKAGESYEYTFSTQADFTQPGTYDIKAWTALEGDELANNNECSTSVQHCKI